MLPAVQRYLEEVAALTSDEEKRAALEYCDNAGRTPLVIAL